MPPSPVVRTLLAKKENAARRPRLPTGRPRYWAPWASAASSTTMRPWRVRHLLHARPCRRGGRRCARGRWPRPRRDLGARAPRSQVAGAGLGVDEDGRGAEEPHGVGRSDHRERRDDDLVALGDADRRRGPGAAPRSRWSRPPRTRSPSPRRRPPRSAGRRPGRRDPVAVERLEHVGALVALEAGGRRPVRVSAGAGSPSMDDGLPSRARALGAGGRSGQLVRGRAVRARSSAGRLQWCGWSRRPGDGFGRGLGPRTRIGSRRSAPSYDSRQRRPGPCRAPAPGSPGGTPVLAGRRDDREDSSAEPAVARGRSMPRRWNPVSSAKRSGAMAAKLPTTWPCREARRRRQGRPVGGLAVGGATRPARAAAAAGRCPSRRALPGSQRSHRDPEALAALAARRLVAGQPPARVLEAATSGYRVHSRCCTRPDGSG